MVQTCSQDNCTSCCVLQERQQQQRDRSRCELKERKQQQKQKELQPRSLDLSFGSGNEVEASLFHQIFVFAVPPDRCGGNFHCNLYCFRWWHDFKWICDIVWLYSAWKWIQLNKLRLKPSKGNWGLTNWLSPSTDIQDTNFRWHRTRDVRVTHSNVDWVTNAGKSLYDESCQTFDRVRLVFPVSLKSLTIYSKTYLINEQLVAKYHKEM